MAGARIPIGELHVHSGRWVLRGAMLLIAAYLTAGSAVNYAYSSSGRFTKMPDAFDAGVVVVLLAFSAVMALFLFRNVQLANHETSRYKTATGLQNEVIKQHLLLNYGLTVVENQASANLAKLESGERCQTLFTTAAGETIDGSFIVEGTKTRYARVFVNGREYQANEQAREVTA